MKFPVARGFIGSSFKPTFSNYNIVETVLIYISISDSVRKNLRARYIFGTQCVAFPRRFALSDGSFQPYDLFFSFISAKNVESPVAVYVNKAGRFIGNTDGIGNDVFCPNARFVMRVFKPEGGFARKINNNNVIPSVQIDVHAQVQERVTVFFSGIKYFGHSKRNGFRGGSIWLSGSHFMFGPEGSFKPIITGYDVQFSIFVQVGNGDSFGYKIPGQLGFFEPALQHSCYGLTISKSEGKDSK